MNEVRCPECGGNLVKVGCVWSGRNYVQQYQCKSCGRRTVHPITCKGELALKPA